MADMLVDSTKLDACLDAEADAIRAKTGDSNDLTFDFANNKGFADAIAAIPTGGGDPQVRNWKVLVGTVTQTSKATAVSFSTGIISGELVSFEAYLADGVESLPEFPADVPSQIVGHTFRAGPSVLPGSQLSQISLIRTSAGADSSYIANTSATISADGTLSFGNARGSYSLPNTTYKYVAVIEVPT